MNAYDPRSFRSGDSRPTITIDRERFVPKPQRTVSSNALFQGSREIAIDHFGATYRLRITRQGKLILNK